MVVGERRAQGIAGMRDGAFRTNGVKHRLRRPALPSLIGLALGRPAMAGLNRPA